MKKIIPRASLIMFPVLALLFLPNALLTAQTFYTGTIDKYPIEISLEISGRDVTGVYAYSNLDEPIELNGSIKEKTLTLSEKKNGKPSATFSFSTFDAAARTVTGTWTDLRTNKKLIVTATRSADPSPAVLQAASLPGKYFKLALTGSGNSDFRVSEVKLFEKKTDRLIQVLPVDCRWIGFRSIDIGDFNFDGPADFSIFESSYAGPNTSSLYFLFDPKTGMYFESGFSGVSLEFDPKRKVVTETNQCCAGASITKFEYTVMNNKMVLRKEQCFKWNERLGKHVERKLADCK